MKFLFTIGLWCCLCLPLKAQTSIPIIHLEELKNRYTQANDTTYIINFFATWCGPCIREMPVLNAFYEKNKDTKMQLIIVSLDQVGYAKKVAQKLSKLKVKAPTYLLQTNGSFDWLPSVDVRWQGSIPATLIIQNNKKVKALLETPLEEGQLEMYLQKLGL